MRIFNHSQGILILDIYTIPVSCQDQLPPLPLSPPLPSPLTPYAAPAHNSSEWKIYPAPSSPNTSSTALA